MSDNMWLEAYDEVMGEIENGSPVQSVTEYLKELGPMPTEALLLGKCTDGLPLLLNLHDPEPLSVLMISQFDTLFLSSISVAIESANEKISYGVITDRPDYWQWVGSPCVGVFSAHHRSAEDFILSAASWAHGNKSSKEVVILLLDNFSKWYEQMEMDAIQNLRWLLMRGSARRVWVIASADRNVNDGFKTIFTATSPTQFLFHEGDKSHVAYILEPK